MFSCLFGKKLQQEHQQVLETKDRQIEQLTSTLAALHSQNAGLQDSLGKAEHQVQLQSKLNAKLVDKSERLQAELLRDGSVAQGLQQRLLELQQYSSECEDKIKSLNHRLGASTKDRDRLQKKNDHLEQAIYLLQQVVIDFQHAETAGTFTPSASMKSSLRQSTEALHAILKQSRQYEAVQPIQRDYSAASRRDQQLPSDAL